MSRGRRRPRADPQTRHGSGVFRLAESPDEASLSFILDSQIPVLLRFARNPPKRVMKTASQKASARLCKLTHSPSAAVWFATCQGFAPGPRKLSLTISHERVRRYQEVFMAIHHVQVSSYSRSKGDNALAKAAYRTGSVMKDEASGEIWDFSKKKNVDFVEMIFPESQKEMDRQDFWNMAERIETRSNSNTCKELRFSLPIELSSPARLAMARKYVRKLVERYGFTADLAYHLSLIHISEPTRPY